MYSQVLNISVDIQNYSTIRQGNFFLYLTAFAIYIFFPCVKVEFHVFLLVPFASCPVSKHYWKETGSLIFIISHQVFLRIDEIPLEFSFLQTEQPQLSLTSHTKNA